MIRSLKLVCKDCGAEDPIDNRFRVGDLEECSHCKSGTQEVREYFKPTFEDATVAREILKDQLHLPQKIPEWLGGVGIFKEEDGSYAVALLVRESYEDSTEVAALPNLIEGVPIVRHVRPSNRALLRQLGASGVSYGEAQE